jgi:FkbM family methyltransferase
MLIDDKNSEALRLRDSYRTLHLEKFLPTAELRKIAPYRGYVDVSISGVPIFSMLSNNDDFVAERYFWSGADAYEPMSLRVWSALAARSAVTLDVGSYTGVYALAAATINRKSKVHAFEALDRVYFRLLMNKEANGLGNLSTWNLAVSDTEGHLALNVYSGESVLVTASSIREKSRAVTEQKSVRAVSLDQLRSEQQSIQAKVGLLKIDAEGAEHLVLAGARRLLEEMRPDILCEILEGAEADAMTESLRALGYRFLRIDDQNSTLVETAELSAAKGMHDLNTLVTTKTKEEVLTSVAALSS